MPVHFNRTSEQQERKAVDEDHYWARTMTRVHSGPLAPRKLVFSRKDRVERSRELERHGRVWQGQAAVVKDVFDTSFRHRVARHLQPGVFGAGPGGNGKGLRRLGFVDRKS